MRGGDLSIGQGECIAVVGESGCGKTVNGCENLSALIPRILKSIEDTMANR